MTGWAGEVRDTVRPGAAWQHEAVPEPTDDQRRILDALVARARPVIRAEFQADSCIATTRVGLDVLRYFGIPAQEYPLLVAIFNPEAVQLLADGLPMEELAARTQAIGPEEPSGPWSVGLGMSPVPGGRANGWSGHLVIGSPALGIVADLSADQASRPHKQIVLEPYWASIGDPAWFADPAARQFLMLRERGVLLVLDRGGTPDPDGYRRSPNWKRRAKSDPGLYNRLTGQIIRAMKADLDA